MPYNNAIGQQMRHITDPSFKYTSALKTDLKKTFARVRRERREQSPEQEAESELLTIAQADSNEGERALKAIGADLTAGA